MNKYQKALMGVEEIAYKQYEDACYNKTTKAQAMEYEQKLKDNAKILQELVDVFMKKGDINKTKGVRTLDEIYSIDIFTTDGYLVKDAVGVSIVSKNDDVNTGLVGRGKIERNFKV